MDSAVTWCMPRDTSGHRAGPSQLSSSMALLLPWNMRRARLSQRPGYPTLERYFEADPVPVPHRMDLRKHMVGLYQMDVLFWSLVDLHHLPVLLPNFPRCVRAWNGTCLDTTLFGITM